MASGERLTVSYSHTESGPLRLDIYCTVPPVDPIDPTPNLDRLPFLLFIHGGHFYSGSRRDVPPWLISLARSLGTPLLCMDYRLAPHAGPSHAFEDLQNLWQFIQTDLPLIIASTGRGAGVESGTDPLEDDFIDLQNRGGVDPAKGVLVGLGAGGYLAALGGSYLSPPPIALVLGYPVLDFDSQSHASNGSSDTDIPNRLKDFLSKEKAGDLARAKSSVPDMPLLLNRAPYASNIRESTGMHPHESFPGKEESLQREGLVHHLLATNQWGPSLLKASPDAQSGLQMLTSGKRCNRPYPPCIIFHGLEDTRIPHTSSQRFIGSIRQAEPVAAAVDALSQPVTYSQTSTPPQEDNSSVSFQSSVANVNETGRYVFLGIQAAGHAFDALLPRMLSTIPWTRNSPKVMGDRYRAGMLHVDHFVKHWLAEGSASLAAAQQNVDRPNHDALQGPGSNSRRSGPRL